MRIHLSIVTLAIAALGGPSALAHHSFAAEFSYELTGTIEGEIIEVLFVNPHARYFIAVKDESGNEVIWDLQTRSTNALTRVGWTKDTLRVGDKVAVEGNLGRDNTHKLWIREVRTASGQVVRPAPAQTQP